MQQQEQQEKEREEVKQASMKVSVNQNNDINFHKILSGEESRTTVMIRNIPNKFKQMVLLDMINLKHQNKYDYFYLPMDLKVTII
jgi:hypothetical protein